MFNIDEIIELNNKRFLITHKTFYKEHTYYYLSAIENSEIALVKEEIINGESRLISLSNDNEVELILSLMLKEEFNTNE